MAFWGVGQGIVAFIVALILRHPPAHWVPAGWHHEKSKAVAQSRVNFTWIQTLGRPEFYLLYAMFFFACAGGLIATGNLSQIAKSLKVSDAKVWGVAIVPLTATLTSIATLCPESCGVQYQTGWGGSERCS